MNGFNFPTQAELDAAGATVTETAKLGDDDALPRGIYSGRRQEDFDLDELFDERDLIELEENVKRKDLTAYERSKTITRAVEVAEKVEEADPQTAGTPRSNGQGGRGKKGGRRAASARVGVDEKTARDAEKHVEIADEHSFMQSPSWSQKKIDPAVFEFLVPADLECGARAFDELERGFYALRVGSHRFVLADYVDDGRD